MGFVKVNAKVHEIILEFDLSVYFASQCKPVIDSSGPYTQPEHGLTAAKVFAKHFFKSTVDRRCGNIYKLAISFWGN